VIMCDKRVYCVRIEEGTSRGQPAISFERIEFVERWRRDRLTWFSFLASDVEGTLFSELLLEGAEPEVSSVTSG
jgi:hypothetical protein